MAMKKGDRGPGVIALQRGINDWIAGRGADDTPVLRALACDGAYGAQTAYVVSIAQAQAGLPATGDANDDTLPYFGLEPGTTATNTAIVDSTGGGI